MRIVLALAGRASTPAELHQELRDIPLATLYRQINRLVEGGVLVVVEERKKRNTAERVYTLRTGAAFAGLEQAARFSREEHLSYFVSFLLTLLGDYARFLQTADLPAELSRIGYQKLPLYLSEADFISFSQALNSALLPYVSQEPGTGRSVQLFSLVTMPGAPITPPDEINLPDGARPPDHPAG
jgi:hypothetical protein